MATAPSLGCKSSRYEAAVQDPEDFTENPAQNRASLHRLVKQLEPSAAEIKAIAASHSGMLTTGLAPLTEFVASDK